MLHLQGLSFLFLEILLEIFIYIEIIYKIIYIEFIYIEMIHISM